MIQFGQDEEGVEAVYRLPYGLIRSDGSSMPPDPIRAHTEPSRGSWPAMCVNAGHTARRPGLRDRGTIRSGNVTDLVIFDPAAVADTADFDEPHRYPVGINGVIVDGQVAVKDGAPTGELAGQVLRGPFRNG